MNVIIAQGSREQVPALLRNLAGREVRLIHDGDGAPMLADLSLNISISHSPHYCAVASHPTLRIGIDIEEPRLEQLARVAFKFLTPYELAAKVPLLTAWTIKEAVFKAAGSPALFLSSIDTLSIPGMAVIPDGRIFDINTVTTPHYTLSTACPFKK